MSHLLSSAYAYAVFSEFALEWASNCPSSWPSPLAAALTSRLRSIHNHHERGPHAPQFAAAPDEAAPSAIRQSVTRTGQRTTLPSRLEGRRAAPSGFHDGHPQGHARSSPTIGQVHHQLRGLVRGPGAGQDLDRVARAWGQISALDLPSRTLFIVALTLTLGQSAFGGRWGRRIEKGSRGCSHETLTSLNRATRACPAPGITPQVQPVVKQNALSVGLDLRAKEAPGGL